MKQSMLLGIVTLLLYLIWLALAYFSGKEEIGGESKGIRRWILKVGIHLARLFEKRGWILSGIRTEITALYPGEDPAEKCRQYYAEKLALVSVVFLLGSSFLWVAAIVSEQDSILQNRRELTRGGYEDEDQEISLVITEEDTGNSRIFDHVLLGRTYRKEELEQMAEQLTKELPQLILGENPDSDHIRSDLSLKGKMEGYPFLLDWESSDYSLVDSDGTVCNEELSAEEDLTLTANLSYREFEKEVTIPVRILPMLLSESQKEEQLIRKQLTEADQMQREDELYVLPETLQGKKVSYRLEGEGQIWLLLPLLGLIAVLLYVGKDKDLEKEITNRKKKIENAYPSFVGKFVLLYGAGMSVRKILERLSLDIPQPELRQQLQLLNRDLHNGILEQQALESFGKRTGSGLYIKFSGLLISSQKKGNTQLAAQMKEEADEAFVMRRNLAKKLGEEAGTKLCFPMILMLGVVMAVIMIPAFLSF